MTRTRVLAILLFISLAINLFIAGIAVGRIGHWKDFGHKGGYHGPFSGRMIERTLGDDLPPELRDRLTHHFESMRANREAMRDSRRAVRDTLLREPFDREAYMAALESMNGLHDQMRDEINAFMIEMAENLTPEQRRQLVEGFEHRRKWRW